MQSKVAQLAAVALLIPQTFDLNSERLTAHDFQNEVRKVDLTQWDRGLTEIDAKAAKIIIIDIFDDQPLSISQAHGAILLNSRLKFSPYPIEAYDINFDSSSKESSTDNLINTLRSIDASYDANIVITLSLSQVFSYDTINNILRQGEGDDFRVEITPENLLQECARIQCRLAPELFELKEVIDRLIEKEVTIVVGVGNDSNKAFNLLTALNPDVIVAGAWDGFEPEKYSNSNSTVDAWATGEAKLNWPTIYQGTSIATPAIAIEAHYLKSLGFSNRQINLIFQAKSSTEMLEEGVSTYHAVQVLRGFSRNGAFRKIDSEQIEMMRDLHGAGAQYLQTLDDNGFGYEQGVAIMNWLQFKKNLFYVSNQKFERFCEIISERLASTTVQKFDDALESAFSESGL